MNQFKKRILFFFKKNLLFGVFGICASICIVPEIQCLPYEGLFWQKFFKKKFIYFNFYNALYFDCNYYSFLWFLFWLWGYFQCLILNIYFYKRCGIVQLNQKPLNLLSIYWPYFSFELARKNFLKQQNFALKAF